MVPQWLIEKKRDKRELTEEEIRAFIHAYTIGEIPDYQMAAMAMAIYLNGMTFEETAFLTDAMMHSGKVIDTSGIPGTKSDKHSTGGIGDKVSLILAPLVACCGVVVPMISGRGLGITGGTLDKMESIPGYRVDLSEAEFLATLEEHQCSMIGQTSDIAPADKKLYALRDVTATVPSIPLITASIMCKKLAEGIDSLVLDVKWGKGAFMKTREDAEHLARNMVEVGTRMGKKVNALITDMNQPLGRSAGNAVEVVEALECLNDKGPDDLMQVTLQLSARMLILAGRVKDTDEAMELLQGYIKSGEAFHKFKHMVAAHGGDPQALIDVSQLPQAASQRPLPAPSTGYVAEVDADLIGRAVQLLGAGRMKTEDQVDHAVGITHLVKVGEHVTKGNSLLTIHTNPTSQLEEAQTLFDQAIVIVSKPVQAPPLINQLILPEGSSL
ncbi:MAG: pyrimidine-nucleoside phosphorylase [Kiritimatiellia bacterium]|jgi:pyrimidine-nucleoside phosphorylase